MSFALKGAVEEGMEESVEALAASSLTGFQFANFGHPLGEFLLQRQRGDRHGNGFDLFGIDVRLTNCTACHLRKPPLHECQVHECGKVLGVLDTGMKSDPDEI